MTNTKNTEKWKPKYGDRYYVPNHIISITFPRCDAFTWKGTDDDKWLLENDLAFKTEEEAISVAKIFIVDQNGDNAVEQMEQRFQLAAEYMAETYKRRKINGKDR